MNTEELDQALTATLEDGKLSRSERGALFEVLSELELDAGRLAQLRARAFELAREKIEGPRCREAFDWLEEVNKLFVRLEAPVSNTPSRAYFSPGDACLSAVIAELGRARKTADICVFTITDDRIANAVLAAHQRGVTVRILTDNDKQYDEGSDIERLARAGIALKVDETEHHMHHKFAVLDGTTLLNGSYNWTRSAAAHNEENVIVTSEPKLVQTFAGHFAQMWSALGH
jgi:phosphatidylserine/phosphatidylglycerophosphate/cardiolipin synthase-like enzyme